MKVIKVQNSSILEDYAEIHFQEMNTEISDIIAYIESDSILIGKSEEGARLIKPTDIFYIEIVDRKNFAYLKDEVIKINEGLKELSEGLLKNKFVRINKSTLVNIYKIENMKAESNMRIKLTLNNGENVIVNRAYRKELFSFLAKLGKELKN